jgi:hypothetical protein
MKYYNPEVRNTLSTVEYLLRFENTKVMRCANTGRDVLDPDTGI